MLGRSPSTTADCSGLTAWDLCQTSNYSDGSMPVQLIMMSKLYSVHSSYLRDWYKAFSCKGLRTQYRDVSEPWNEVFDRTLVSEVSLHLLSYRRSGETRSGNFTRLFLRLS